jgi:hypothetical protein
VNLAALATVVTLFLTPAAFSGLDRSRPKLAASLRRKMRMPTGRHRYQFQFNPPADVHYHPDCEIQVAGAP